MSPDFKQAKIGNQVIKFDPGYNRVLVGYAKDREILSFYKLQPDLVKDSPFTDAINEALRKTGLSQSDVTYK